MMLNSLTTFEQVCEALGFSKSSGLFRKEDPVQVDTGLKMWIKVTEKFGIDAIFFIQTEANKPGIPIIYFKRIEEYDEAGIINLHKAIWNQGRIPLLFVILPGEVKIYNCFEPPCSSEEEPFDTEKRLIQYLKTFMSIEDIRRELASFTHQELYTGRFWQEKKSLFDLNNKADFYLLNNLRIVRRVLKNDGLADEFIHRLIARSIMILCLEDRGALTEFFKSFKDGQYEGFRQLVKNKEHTYELFEIVNEHFNGDVFPITAEERHAVSEKHLNILQCFLLGTNPETKQTRLWPYRFDIIPIEFISNIYEEFFQYERKKSQSKDHENLGTYYTPQPLVSFMLETILCWNQREDYPKILDPSCGSGIYLVEAYRRIINQKINAGEEVNAEKLKGILQHCIFGVDVNKEATSIAAFSLYLTMLDYLPSELLWQLPKLFPKLIDVNIHPVDFFDSWAPFNKMKFDFIIGNVPWLSIGQASKTLALRYCRLIHRTVSDRQIAQAFLWKALNLVDVQGEICLIMGAKSLLFNRSKKNKLFRKELLEKANVKTIVNLSVLRRNLFNRSVGPAAIIHCGIRRPSITNEINSILYISPKASFDTRYTGAVVIDKSDYAPIPLQIALEDDSIWKTAMWGTPRDHELIIKARTMGTLGEIIGKKKWVIGDGFQRKGSDRIFAQWLLNYPHIPAKSLSKYHVDKTKLESIEDPVFHRPRKKERYTAPLCLMKVTLKEGDIVSAFSDNDISYTDGIIGISGKPFDTDLLKILCCYLNSDVAKYFLFLTCSVWGVERDDIVKDDLLNLPIIFPQKDSNEYSMLLSICNNILDTSKLDSKVNDIEILQKQVNSIFYSLFNLNEIERKIIVDTINYTIDYYQKRENSIATQSASNNVLREYVNESLLILNPMAKNSENFVASKIYSGNDALKIVSFAFENKSESIMNIPSIQVIDDMTEMNKTLNELVKYLGNEQHENVFLKRIMRIYEDAKVFVIKPNERRYWTGIEAFRDSDDMLAEIFGIWRKKQLASNLTTIV